MSPEDISEIRRPLKPKALNYWVVLFWGVAPIWAITPLSWAYAAAVIYTGAWKSMGWAKWVSFALALAEVAFTIYYRSLAILISAHPRAHGPERIPEMRAELKRCLQAGLRQPGDDVSKDHPELDKTDPRAVNFRNMLRPWFQYAPWSDIRERELRQWLHWQLFNAPLPENEADLTEEHEHAIKEAAEVVRKLSGCEIQQGSNPSVKPILLTVDEMPISSRPLGWYLSVAAGFQMAKWVLQTRYNVQFSSYDGVDYAIRLPLPSPNHDKASHRPIVVLHGLGLGLVQYFPFLVQLMETHPHRPILFPIQPHIAQMFFHPRFLTPFSRHDMADRLAALMDDLGWAYAVPPTEHEGDSGEEKPAKRPGVTVLSHSNGSYVHTWLCKGYPHMIARSCFVDPVCFCSWEGDVCYNFMYRVPTNGLELVMRYFIATEMGVANLLHRQFDWTANCIYPEEIPAFTDPSRTTIWIGAKDAIINAHRVYQHLTTHGARKGIHCDPSARHGDALISGTAECNRILRWLGDEVAL